MGISHVTRMSLSSFTGRRFDDIHILYYEYNQSYSATISVVDIMTLHGAKIS